MAHDEFRGSVRQHVEHRQAAEGPAGNGAAEPAEGAGDRVRRVAAMQQDARGAGCRRRGRMHAKHGRLGDRDGVEDQLEAQGRSSGCGLRLAGKALVRRDDLAARQQERGRYGPGTPGLGSAAGCKHRGRMEDQTSWQTGAAI